MRLWLDGCHSARYKVKGVGLSKNGLPSEYIPVSGWWVVKEAVTMGGTSEWGPGLMCRCVDE